MKITWLGHSAFRIETGGSVVLIDPFLTGNPVFKGTSEAASQAATHVVLTHGHEDHVGDTVAICKRTGALLVANWEICNYLGGQGVENWSAGNHGGRIVFDDFDVVFTNAWHSSSNIVDGKPVYLGNPAGIVLIAKAEQGKNVHHMGDTGLHGDMALVEELYRPRIGIVPIGDRFTMGAEQAAYACKRFFRFETILPCHYKTFPIIEPSADAFLAAMGEDAGKVKVLDSGGSIEV
jgi:L-ascorbate metabolism protein UlaG (beta-lactamase superfamily)